MWGSNPRLKLGRLQCFHYTNPARIAGQESNLRRPMEASQPAPTRLIWRVSSRDTLQHVYEGLPLCGPMLQDRERTAGVEPALDPEGWSVRATVTLRPQMRRAVSLPPDVEPVDSTDSWTVLNANLARACCTHPVRGDAYCSRGAVGERPGKTPRSHDGIQGISGMLPHANS